MSYLVTDTSVSKQNTNRRILLNCVIFLWYYPHLTVMLISQKHNVYKLYFIAKNTNQALRWRKILQLVLSKGRYNKVKTNDLSFSAKFGVWYWYWEVAAFFCNSGSFHKNTFKTNVTECVADWNNSNVQLCFHLTRHWDKSLIVVHSCCQHGIIFKCNYCRTPGFIAQQWLDMI